MPKPRNYWVLRGLRGAAARQKYLDYLSGVAEIDDNVGQGAARPATQYLYLEPFSLPLAVDHIMRDSALSTAWTALSGKPSVGSHVTADATGKTVVNVPSYKAPRIVHITLDATGVRTVSKYTGLPYLKYDHTSQSIPFGSNLVGDTVASVYGDLSAGMTDATHKTRLIDERY